MGRIISLHEYELRESADPASFLRSMHRAEAEGSLNLPGLTGHHFLRGVRGSRRGKYASLWVYQSIAAWESIWGPTDEPVAKADYPPAWQAWERALAPYLAQDPDAILFTAYEEI